MGFTFPMNGGNGAYSYTKNSQFQKEASDFAKRMFQDAIMQKLELPKTTDATRTVRMADLGCSVGPNTFSTVDYLIQAVEDKHRSRSEKEMEFQVFFNDHASNDFNTLLTSLPPTRKYHAAAVPGSFHRRVFPRASIAVAHSSYALQWLSGFPDEIASSNKGGIFYAGGDDDVSDAYSLQFARDAGEFMCARAEEIVEGGLMFLILPGIAEGVSHARSPFASAFDLFHSTLRDFAARGAIDEAKIEGFNIPMYFPSAEEVGKVIEENGCLGIEGVEVANPAPGMSARDIIIHLRAALEGTFRQQFGEFATEKMFSKCIAKAGEDASNSQMVEDDLYQSAQLFYVLKRK